MMLSKNECDKLVYKVKAVDTKIKSTSGLI